MDHYSNVELEEIIADILENYIEEDILKRIIRYEICEIYIEKNTLNIEEDIVFQHSIIL